MCMLKYLLIKPKKIFECFICFWKWFFYFHVFSFLSKCIFVFFYKNWFRGNFTRSLQLRASHESWLREIKFLSIHTESLATVSRALLTTSREMFLGKNWIFFNPYKGYRDYFVAYSQLTISRKSFWASMAILATSLLLPNPQKMCVFSIIRQMWQVFKTLSFPSLRLSRTTLNPKPLFTQTPSVSTSRYVF